MTADESITGPLWEYLADGVTRLTVCDLGDLGRRVQVDGWPLKVELTLSAADADWLGRALLTEETEMVDE